MFRFSVDLQEFAYPTFSREMLVSITDIRRLLVSQTSVVVVVIFLATEGVKSKCPTIKNMFTTGIVDVHKLLCYARIVPCTLLARKGSPLSTRGLATQRLIVYLVSR